MAFYDGLAEMAAAQQQAMLSAQMMRGQAGLGGLLGQAVPSPYDVSRESYRESRPKSIKDELQDEVNEWLKDTI
jgi:hypothetical protein